MPGLCRFLCVTRNEPKQRKHTGTTPILPNPRVPRLPDYRGPGYCGWKVTNMAYQCKNKCSLSVGVCVITLEGCGP